MNRSGWLVVLVVLAGCDPTVSIGDPDAGLDAGLGGGAGGGTGGGSGGGGGGDTLCTRLASAGDGIYASGQTSCMGTSNTLTRDPDAQSTCSTGISMCSTADRTALDTYVTCLQQVPQCTAGNENRTVSAFMNCVSTAFSSLSTSCRTAIVRVRPAGKRVFITRGKFNGDLGGLAGADTKCADAAAAAGVNGTWKAWLSSSTVNAIDRLNDVGPWVDLQGTTIFASKSAITSSGPATGIWYDERGMFLSSENVWTATNSQGLYQWGVIMEPPCVEWTSSSMQKGAQVGQVGRTGSAWTSHAGTTCDQNTHLLCFEQ